MFENIQPINNKNQCHGFWLCYYSDGVLWYKGYFKNNIDHGYWIENWNVNITKSKSKIRFYIK